MDIVANQIAPDTSELDFLQACTALMDEGLIMYEALLTGVDPSPMLLAAALTAKGHRAFHQPR